eukprot:scaffold24878_cov147-Cylindrotheca_fusiformis.AAC.2
MNPSAHIRLETQSSVSPAAFGCSGGIKSGNIEWDRLSDGDIAVYSLPSFEVVYHHVIDGKECLELYKGKVSVPKGGANEKRVEESHSFNRAYRELVPQTTFGRQSCSQTREGLEQGQNL